jgi:hypothetical protein
MAQIRRRGPSQYQACERLTGHPEVSRTFSTRQDAIAWASENERLLMQGLGDAIRGAEQLTLYQALDRYAKEVTPSKRSQQQELSRLRRWCQSSALSRHPFPAEWRHFESAFQGLKLGCKNARFCMLLQ